MPLKLKAPRPGKTAFYYVRGKYLGTRVNRTCETADEAAARRVLKLWREQIERGCYLDPRAEGHKPLADSPLTFAHATLAYLRAGGERHYIKPILELPGPHAIRDKAIADIDQPLLDNAADALFPGGTAQTKNRQFYTPVSAVLKRAGIDKKIKRPKGWRGSKSQSWLEPDQAFALIDAAYAIDQEFGAFCLTLLYTGMRLSEALDRSRLRHLDLQRGMLYLPKTKNSDPRAQHLPPIVVAALRAMPARPKRVGSAGRSQGDAGIPFLERHPDSRIFRFHIGGALRDMLNAAMTRAGLSFPRRQGGFHLFCHTYGTWMHRYGDLDTFGLTRTGRWKDERSADRYRHTAVSEESRRADLLPVPKRQHTKRKA